MSDQRRNGNEHNSNSFGNSNCNKIRNGYMQNNYEGINTNGNTFNRKDHEAFKDESNVLNKGKRYRDKDSDESKIIFLSLDYHHRDSRNNTVSLLENIIVSIMLLIKAFLHLNNSFKLYRIKFLSIFNVIYSRRGIYFIFEIFLIN